MKRAALAIVSTITGLVLLLSFKTHALGTPATPPAAVSSASAGTSSSGTGGSSGGGSSARSGGSARSSGGGSSATSTRTVTGNAANTIYGPVQVRITVRNGRVVSATAVEYPEQDPRDAQINAYAIPVLNQEAAQAGSADIAHVSGATYTSEGYIASLQSALNQAGL